MRKSMSMETLHRRKTYHPRNDDDANEEQFESRDDRRPTTTMESRGRSLPTTPAGGKGETPAPTTKNVYINPVFIPIPFLAITASATRHKTHST